MKKLNDRTDFGPPTGKRTACLWLVITALFLVVVPSASAEVTKFYNAAHSLTGDCATSSVDPIPDPGCPTVQHPPEGPLLWPKSVATDSYGNIYVVTGNDGNGYGNVVDVFDSGGRYLTQVAVPEAVFGAVDATGHLYVRVVGGRVLRFDPTAYNPKAGEVAFDSTPVLAAENASHLAVDPSNGHLYVTKGASSFTEGWEIVEYAAAEEGTPNQVLVTGIGAYNSTPEGVGQIALDAARHRIYATDLHVSGGTRTTEVKIFDSRAPYAYLGAIDGSDTPSGAFLSEPPWRLELAVDENTGHVFVGDISRRKGVFEYDENGAYQGALKKPPLLESDTASMTIDNWPESPNRGYLYVPSGEVSTAGHLFAYEPKTAPKPPVIEALSVSNVTEDEAVLRATINPGGQPTHYVLEYASQEEEGFAAAQVAGEGDLSASGEGVAVSAPVTGLSARGSYRFRVRVDNQCLPGGCSAEEQGAFTTFGPYAQGEMCPNAEQRMGASAALPDCRAYELVTPADTGGIAPLAPSANGDTFGTPPASPNGDSFAYIIWGGSMPGFDATGAFSGDTYAADRTAAGWQSTAIGPNGPQAVESNPGGLSADHDVYTFEAYYQGSLLINGESADYLRYPDDSFHLAGVGSLGTDPQIDLHYITPHGSHSFFTSTEHLEPEAPPPGSQAIYDRAFDGALRVVSLLPDETPADQPVYLGTSLDGSEVAFTERGLHRVYVRVDNLKTLLAAPAGSEFAGLSEDGRYLFYRSGGDLYRFDSQGEETTPITDVGDVIPVDVARSGTAAYFLSSKALPTGLNPNGAAPVASKHNLYYWDGSAIHFVASVTPRDVVGQSAGGAATHDGLGLWLEAVSQQTPAVVSSRSTPDGSTLLFESRANLASFESGERAEIYRYDSEASSLTCLSCDPTGGEASSDAALLTMTGLSPVRSFSSIPNLSPDGNRAFFESSERLVLGDIDNVKDVYEWEAEGKGACAEPGGCLFLISTGQSAYPNYLLGVSASGDDVFFQTTDLLVGQDQDETPSVYDARVGGGFPSPPVQSGECLGEACQPAAAAPADPTPGSATFEGKGNVVRKAVKGCSKGKRRAGRPGRHPCVKRHKKHRRQNRTDAHRRAHR